MRCSDIAVCLWADGGMTTVPCERGVVTRTNDPNGGRRYISRIPLLHSERLSHDYKYKKSVLYLCNKRVKHSFLGGIVLNILKKFPSSVKELKSLSCIALCGMFIALRVAIGFLAIPIGDYNRIDFSYIPVAISGYMFGPVLSGFVGGLSDIITLLFKPTGMWNPIITLSKAVSGVVFGVFLYKSKPSIKITAIMCAVNWAVCDLFLTTLGLCTIGGMPFDFIFPIRLLTYTLLLPLNVAIIYFGVKSVSKISRLSGTARI